MAHPIIWTSFWLTLMVSGITADGGHAAYHWSYGGSTDPSSWSEHHPVCGGNSQSPINLDTNTADANLNLGKTAVYTAPKSPVRVNIENNGHAVTVAFKEPTLNVSGMGLPGTYAMVQMHFHHRSEHTVNGERYPVELHMVCYNLKYNNFTEALDKSEGLAVLGVLFEKTKTANNALKPIMDILNDVKYKGQSHATSSFPWNFPAVLQQQVPHFDERLFRYSGSLTTPPCYESVVWTMFKDPQPISQSQLEMFNSMMFNARGESEDRMVDNFRPTLPLNGRRVTRTFTTGGATSLTCNVIILGLLAAVISVIY